MTNERLFKILSIIRADYPTYSDNAEDFKRGWNACLDSIEKAIRFEEAVRVERVADFADEAWTESELRFAAGDR